MLTISTQPVQAYFLSSILHDTRQDRAPETIITNQSLVMCVRDTANTIKNSINTTMSP